MKELIKASSEVIGKKLDDDRFLVVGNAFGKRSMFLYDIHGERPHYIIKMPGNIEGMERCKIEYEALEYLKTEKLPNIEHAVPIGKVNYHGIECFIQTTVYGKPMLGKLRLFRKTPNEGQFRFVTDHLIAIYNSTRHLSRQKDRSYSSCFQHGDFWLGNLARSGNSLILHDLEFATTTGQPLYDLLHFGMYHHRVVQNIGKVGRSITGNRGQSDKDQRVFELSSYDVEAVLEASGPFSKIMKECVLRYLRSCNIDRNDGLQLIRDYIKDDRKIKDVSDDRLVRVLD